MKQEESKKLNYSSLDLILFAWKHKFTILIVGALAGILSMVVSFQITPLFKSEVVMFAPPTTSVSKYLYSQNYVSRHGLLSFGEEEQIEQLLQILNSNQLREKIIDKFNLAEHYGIDSTEAYSQTKLFKKYGSNVNFRRTKYMSIVIEVIDENPQMAADIANTIADEIDFIVNNIQHERAQIAYNLVLEQKKELKNEIRVLEDSIEFMNKQGMFSYENQTERLSEAYAYALKEGNMAGAKRVRDEMNRIANYSSKYMSVRDRVNYLKSQVNYVNQREYEAKIEAQQLIPQHYTVDRAFPADKKVFPKKSIIVLTTTMVSVVLAYILLLILDAIRRYNLVLEKENKK